MSRLVDRLDAGLDLAYEISISHAPAQLIRDKVFDMMLRSTRQVDQELERIQREQTDTQAISH